MKIIELFSYMVSVRFFIPPPRRLPHHLTSFFFHPFLMVVLSTSNMSWARPTHLPHPHHNQNFTHSSILTTWNLSLWSHRTMIQRSTFHTQASSKFKHVFGPTDENTQHTMAGTKKEKKKNLIFGIGLMHLSLNGYMSLYHKTFSTSFVSSMNQLKNIWNECFCVSRQQTLGGCAPQNIIHQHLCWRFSIHQILLQLPQTPPLMLLTLDYLFNCQVLNE